MKVLLIKEINVKMFKILNLFNKNSWYYITQNNQKSRDKSLLE